LARSHVHTKVLQFQPEFHLWLSGLSFNYSPVVFNHEALRTSVFPTFYPGTRVLGHSAGGVGMFVHTYLRTYVVWIIRNAHA